MPCTGKITQHEIKNTKKSKLHYFLLMNNTNDNNTNIGEIEHCVVMWLCGSGMVAISNSFHERAVWKRRERERESDLWFLYEGTTRAREISLQCCHDDYGRWQSMLVILPELLIESGGFRKEIPLCHCISEGLDDVGFTHWAMIPTKNYNIIFLLTIF